MKTAAIIPAHNEEESVGNTIYDLTRQTFPIEKIYVVADNCTDGTVGKVKQLQKDFPTICLIETENNIYRKAGAINMALSRISEEDVADLVLVMDSDSRIAEDLLEKAVESFKKDSLLGGVCSTAHILDLEKKPKSWIRKIEASFLWTLQRLEYGGFDAERTATWRNVTVIHGLCGVYRLDVLEEVKGYALGHLLEDYDLTLKIKKAGWRTKFNPKMKAWTDVPITLKAFFKQRLRWLRGGVDVLLDHGFNKFTAEDIFHHVIFIMLFISILGVVTFSSINEGWQFRFNPHPLPIVVLLFGYFMGLYRLQYVEKIRSSDIFMRIIILPELLIAIAMMGVRLYAYYLVLFGRPQKW